MLKRLAIVACLWPAFAQAQDIPQQVDPRIATELVAALSASLMAAQANVRLQEAIGRAKVQDEEAKAATLWQWFLAARGLKPADFEKAKP